MSDPASKEMDTLRAELALEQARNETLRRCMRGVIAEIPDYSDTSEDLPEAVRSWVKRAKDCNRKLSSAEARIRELEAVLTWVNAKVTPADPAFLFEFCDRVEGALAKKKED